jgi:hypothetical protein
MLSLPRPSTAAVIMLAALVPFTQADVKHDVAIFAYDGATLGDCEWSLLNEHALGAQASTVYKVKDRRAICTNPGSVTCNKSMRGWTFNQCVERVDVYYKDGQAPDTHQSFTNNHGLCVYVPYGQDAGGHVHHNNACFCDEVGGHRTC